MSKVKSSRKGFSELERRLRLSMDKRHQELKRSFESAKSSRLTGDWAASAATQDTELSQDLPTLRARSRQMVRDNPHAMNLKRMIQNNVVGQGIGIQCLVTLKNGKPDQRTNDAIEAAWLKWCEADSCHTAGRLNLNEMLRLIIGAVFQDGEILIREVHDYFGNSEVPFALEVIEPDLLADYAASIAGLHPDTKRTLRLGVEVDAWLRPLAYWFYPFNPGDINMSALTINHLRRIPAEDIIHLYVVDRWPKTRGVPWMHTVLKKLKDMGGYVNSEIIAARAAANIVGFVQREMDEFTSDQNPERIPRYITSQPGSFQRLLPGEKFEGFSPSRPNSNIDAFMRYMLREVAAGVGVSYETLSRDYSQTNYSSSRLALLDDRDQWRTLQSWLISRFLKPVFYKWLDHAVLSGALNLPGYFDDKERYRAVRFKPRGWSWVDPSKEVNAYVQARQAGFMSDSDVVAAIGNGQDYEDICSQIAKDKEIAKLYGLSGTNQNNAPVDSNEKETTKEEEKSSEQAETGAA